MLYAVESHGRTSSDLAAGGVRGSSGVVTFDRFEDAAARAREIALRMRGPFAPETVNVLLVSDDENLDGRVIGSVDPADDDLRLLFDAGEHIAGSLEVEGVTVLLVEGVDRNGDTYAALRSIGGSLEGFEPGAYLVIPDAFDGCARCGTEDVGRMPESGLYCVDCLDALAEERGER